MTNEKNSCNCGSGLFTAVILVALSVLVIMGASFNDALNVSVALVRQETLQEEQAKQVINTRNHYYALYSDLLSLAQKNTEVAILAKKYGIRMNPPTGTSAPAEKP